MLQAVAIKIGRLGSIPLWVSKYGDWLSFLTTVTNIRFLEQGSCTVRDQPETNQLSIAKLRSLDQL
jgi:hypothetical protein